MTDSRYELWLETIRPEAEAYCKAVLLPKEGTTAADIVEELMTRFDIHWEAAKDVLLAALDEWEGRGRKMPPPKTKCLFPGCELSKKSRGLCASHYTTAFYLVKKGKVTWEELVEKGRADPPKRPRILHGATKWFLEGREDGKEDE